MDTNTDNTVTYGPGIDEENRRRVWQSLNGMPYGVSADFRWPHQYDSTRRLPSWAEIIDNLDRFKAALFTVADDNNARASELTALKRDLTAVRRVFGTEAPETIGTGIDDLVCGNGHLFTAIARTDAELAALPSCPRCGAKLGRVS